MTVFPGSKGLTNVNCQGKFFVPSMELTGAWQIVVKFSVAIWITPAIGGIDYQDGKHFKRQNYTYRFIKAIVEQIKLYMSAIFLQKRHFPYFL
jgi:hypothetical protein